MPGHVAVTRARADEIAGARGCATPVKTPATIMRLWQQGVDADAAQEQARRLECGVIGIEAASGFLTRAPWEREADVSIGLQAWI